ncbi:hypothetical protein [Ectopseudomonas composti]|uniref:hypothetical protein n=1 Tax=Ectopseudomonas composti TaxID=658457 RepID=UPI001428D5C7|nr:hypothetical protein [Pseudomonas composti]
MKTSLTTGEWGSFTAPRSRALGGKSGMTRAKPLVLIFKLLPLHFADCLLLVFLALLGTFLSYASLPPYGRPQVPPFIQEQPCQADQHARAEYPEPWIEREPCVTAGAGLHVED